MEPDFIDNLVRNKHNAVYDLTKKHLEMQLLKEWLSQDTYFECKEEYLERYNKWLHTTELNTYWIRKLTHDYTRN